MVQPQKTKFQVNVIENLQNTLNNKNKEKYKIESEKNGESFFLL